MPALKPQPRPTPPSLSLLPKTQANGLSPAQIEAELNQAKRTSPQLRLVPKPNEQAKTKKPSNILNFKDYQANRVNNLVQQQFSDETDEKTGEANDDFDQNTPGSYSGNLETIDDIIAGEQAENLQKNQDQARNKQRIASASETSPNLGLIQTQSPPMQANRENRQESEQSEGNNQNEAPDPTEQESTINSTRDQARNSLSQNVKNTASTAMEKAKAEAKDAGKEIAKKATKFWAKRIAWAIVSGIASFLAATAWIWAWIWIPLLIIFFIVAAVYNYSQNSNWFYWDVFTGAATGNPEKVINNALNNLVDTETAKPADSNSSAGSGSSGNSNAAAETNPTGD